MGSDAARRHVMVNGYHLLTDKIAVPSGDIYRVVFEDGTNVRVMGARLVVNYEGRGVVTCAAPDAAGIEPDEQVFIRDTIIDWAGKIVSDLTDEGIYFEDGSYVQVDTSVFCSVLGGGVIRVQRVASDTRPTA